MKKEQDIFRTIDGNLVRTTHYSAVSPLDSVRPLITRLLIVANDELTSTMIREGSSLLKTSLTTLRVIDALKERGEIGVSDVARELDIPKSSAYNHLQTLREKGYVVKEDSKYRLGLQFLEVGGYLRNQTKLYEVAEPNLDDLAAETGERANLLVEENGMGIYLYLAKSSEAIQTDSYVGFRTHLHSTAVGKAILAYLPQEEVERIVEHRGLPAISENTITSRPALFDELESTRARGYALDDEERLPGLRCVAAPVLTADDEVLGAISVSGPVSRISNERFESELPELVHQKTNIIELQVTYS